MSNTTEEFNQLTDAFKSGGIDAALSELKDFYRAEKRFHELFEVLKMAVRHRLKLPILYDEQATELDESIRNQLEDGLLEACKEVGVGLLEDGKVREGWMYLKPIGDRQLAEDLIRKTEVDDTNLDEVVEVTISEGVAPAYGFSLVLEHYGTCNSITAFETQINQLPRGDQVAAAELLVQHLHAELFKNLKDVIAQQEGQAPPETTIKELVADRDWLFGEMTYHIDTTHLASVVRFARAVNNESTLRLAVDLTEYGRRLHSQFQYQGEEPFADVYPSSALYFRAILGEDIEEALSFFGEKAETIDAYYNGTAAVETYIDLLAKCDRLDDAIEASIKHLPPGTRSMGLAPTLFELCRRKQDFSRMMSVCKEGDDLLGYATALMQSSDAS